MSKVLRAHDIADKQPWLPQQMPIPESAPEEDEVVDPQELLATVRMQANSEAERIISQARQKAESIRQTAYQEGFEQGQQAGKAAADHAYDEKITALSSLIEDINQERDEAFERAEADLVRLSTTIAEKILQQELTLRPEIIVDLVRSHMKHIREREVLRLRVSPEDMPVLTEARQSLLTDVDGVRKIQLYDDRRVGRGGVVIEAESGSLDARVSSQIEVINNALEEALEVPHDSQDN